VVLRIEIGEPDIVRKAEGIVFQSRLNLEAVLDVHWQFSGGTAPYMEIFQSHKALSRMAGAQLSLSRGAVLGYTNPKRHPSRYRH
jgi:hypothetical protein